MDTALLFVTILSVTAAVVSMLAARRVRLGDSQRSEARVAALSAAAFDGVPAGEIEFPSEEHEPALEHQPFASHSSVSNQSSSSDHSSLSNHSSVAGHLRLSGHPRLSDQLRRSTIATISDSRSPIDHGQPTLDDGRSPIDDQKFFGTVRREPPSSGKYVLVAAAAVVVAVGGAVAVFTTSGHTNARPAVATEAHAAPLELVSLDHARENSTLTISGMVRNPSSGLKLEGLTAVVSLIDSHGGLISAKDVPLDYRALGPGEEAPFKLIVPDSGSVARYRVSFRAGTDVVPHVDRRSDTKLASAL